MREQVSSRREKTSRREFLGDLGRAAACLAVAPRPAAALRSSGGPHHPPRAKRVVYLFMAGAPSHLDLFDEKPVLRRYEGRPVPASLVADSRYAFIRKDAALLGPQFAFRRHGECGASISDALPGLARVVDDIAIVRSMHTDQFNHAPAQIFLNTGSPLPGRPSMGAWVSYGLGSEARDLPGFVVLSSGGGTSGGSANWSSGFLPTRHQGVPFLPKGDPIPNLSSPPGVDDRLQRESVALVRELNALHHHTIGDREITARSEAYELALRMQARAPELADLSSEPRHVMDMYGADPTKASFARNCVLARRLLERGVRFVHVYHKGWDHHTDVAGGLRTQCGHTDRASAALVMDLKQRGMLEDTLVIWGGEFGRTPMVESNAALKRKNGRDHHPEAFTVWLAGGGIRPGLGHGSTDDLGFHVAADPVHVHDLQATVLHLLGLDHERLTYTYQGRAFRLTDVHGRVIHGLLS